MTSRMTRQIAAAQLRLRTVAGSRGRLQGSDDQGSRHSVEPESSREEGMFSYGSREAYAYLYTFSKDNNVVTT